MPFSSNRRENLFPATPDAVSDAAVMDAEIRLVARFAALTLWRAVTSALLIAFQLICVPFGKIAPAPVYILLCMNLLPSVLEGLCAPYAKKSVPVLPYLRKQYHYSSLRYMTTGISFAITSFLLLLWQLYNSPPVTPFAWLGKFPAFLLALGFFLRAVSPRLLAGHIRKRMGC